jgi:hypothetical protein
MGLIRQTRGFSDWHEATPETACHWGTQNEPASVDASDQVDILADELVGDQLNSAPQRVCVRQNRCNVGKPNTGLGKVRYLADQFSKPADIAIHHQTLSPGSCISWFASLQTDVAGPSTITSQTR